MSYTTRDGDTFETVSRNVYGVATDAALLRSANPGTPEPMPAGLTLRVPAQGNRQPIGTSASERNEVAVLINGAAYSRWSTVTVTRSLDSLDTYELTGPFEPDEPGFRETFAPFSFAPVVITVGGAPLFTGTQLTPTPQFGTPRTIAVAGYALPGVLSDCSPPASAFPLTFNGLDLALIATQLATPFGVPVIFEGSAGAIFDQVEVRPTDTVLSFLIKLAKQRGLVVGNTTAGALVFRKPAASVPVARLTAGSPPMLSAAPQFNPQAYYSDVTGIEPADVGNEGGQQSTVKNPFARNIMRPKTVDLPDLAAGELQAATEAAFGRMLASSVEYSVEVSTWRNEAGGLWEPGDTVTVTAPGAMIYQPYNFLIRSVTFRRQDVATLVLVLPESFAGGVPARLPWQ